jgi:hypothetical protein
MNRPLIPRFSLGQVVATPAALALLEETGEPFQKFLNRHAVGDWGDALDPEDAALNEQALLDGDRLLSSYKLAGNDNQKLWIITESDRSVTTLLLPSDY